MRFPCLQESVHPGYPTCFYTRITSYNVCYTKLLRGFAGAGAFSDGKLSLSPDVGGNLPDILGYDQTLQLIGESDSIYLKFGADEKVRNNFV